MVKKIEIYNKLLLLRGTTETVCHIAAKII